MIPKISGEGVDRQISTHQLELEKRENNMGLEDVPRCQHVKVNGTQCGSPALRRRRHCYFHDRMLDGKKRFASSKEVRARPVDSMRLLEDANLVQVACRGRGEGRGGIVAGGEQQVPRPPSARSE